MIWEWIKDRFDTIDGCEETKEMILMKLNSGFEVSCSDKLFLTIW